MKTDDLSVLIVSPRAHIVGHMLPSSTQIADALAKKNISYHILFLTRDHLEVDPRHDSHVSSIFHNIPLWFRLIDPVAVKRRYRSLRSFQHFWDLALSSLLCTIKAYFEVRRNKFSAVHFVDGFSPTSILLALFTRVTVLHHCYTFYSLPDGLSFKDRIFSRLQQWLTKRAIISQRIYFIFENKATQEKESVKGLGQFAVHIPWALTIETALPERATCRRQFNIKPDDVVFLLFGGSRISKDYHTVFKAAGRIIPHPCLLFAGPVTDHDPRAIAREHGYDNALFFDKNISPKEAKYFFCASDAVILNYIPGLNDIGGSRVFFEACQHNRPIIATDCPIFDDFINHYGCGILYHHENVEELENCMLNFVRKDQNTMLRLNSGLARFRQDFAWDTMINKYLTLYLKNPA